MYHKFHNILISLLSGILKPCKFIPNISMEEDICGSQLPIGRDTPIRPFLLSHSFPTPEHPLS